MTRQEFITKHGEFQLDTESNEMLMECCHTPEKEHPYQSIFFLTGKMYNHGFYNQPVNLEKVETNWDLLSKDLEFVKKIEAMVEDLVFSSDTDQPYKAFLLSDFKSEKDSFLKDFFTQIGFYFKADGAGIYTNPLFSEILVKEIGENDSVMMTEEPFEDYYEDVETFSLVDKLLKENLKNIHRISFNSSYSFSGGLPIFFVGESKTGNNLLGLFSVGSYT